MADTTSSSKKRIVGHCFQQAFSQHTATGELFCMEPRSDLKMGEQSEDPDSEPTASYHSLIHNRLFKFLLLQLGYPTPQGG